MRSHSGSSSIHRFSTQKDILPCVPSEYYFFSSISMVTADLGALLFEIAPVRFIISIKELTFCF